MTQPIDPLARLTQLWHQTIPIAAQMGIRALDYDGDTLVTGADFEANRNLHGTMFAGSIYSHATLTGWGRIWLALEEAGLQGDIVLGEGRIRYRRPVTGHPQCRCSLQAVDVSPLQQGRNLKIPLQVTLGDAARFEGQFVVMPQR
ncbi:YiiD C-terminal domain-containing protein [Ferrimonas balearica]|uniref:YiiD C-terminal domain-containing protein n=1 Tax=Ferrimonas balearica TaxID=44012 RepID=UPI001C994B9B|nr:YiiD C-terminal domain-containing protein [Ferrimonas balearica]MBY5994109.1 thioesterase domain-containing protein [Ferrimonas balearica]